MLASLLTRRLTRCFASAAVVLAMVASSSSALAAPKAAKPAPAKVVAKEKAPPARHPWKKAKSAPAKPKAKTKPTPKTHPSRAPGPHGDTHAAPLAA